MTHINIEGLKPLGCLVKNIPVQEWTMVQKAEALQDVLTYLQSDMTAKTNPYDKNARTLTLTNGRTVQWATYIETQKVGDKSYGFQHELVFVGNNETDQTKTFIGMNWANVNQLSLLNYIDPTTLDKILHTVSVHRVMQSM